MNPYTLCDEQQNGEVIMTKQLRAILGFVQSEYAKDGFVPNLRNTAIKFGFKSNTTAKYHFDKLISMGYLSKVTGKRAYYPGPRFFDTQGDSAYKDNTKGTENLAQFVVSDNDSSAMGILEGDTVMYREQVEATPNGCCIIQVGNKILVRRMTIKDAHVWYVGDNNSVPAINGLDVQVLGVPVRSYRTW